MQFSKLAIASMLALISSVSSQVVVTVTNTVTVVTITVTPPTTSTSTITVIVTGTPTTTTDSTLTSIVTVTATPPATTSDLVCPAAVGEQCGGFGRRHCADCAENATCSRVYAFYSHCVAKPTVTTIVTTIYGGLISAKA